MDCFRPPLSNHFLGAMWFVVKHLRQAWINPTAGARDAKAPKANGILKTILVPNVLVFSAHLFDILTTIAPLSLAFQARDATPYGNNNLRFASVEMRDFSLFSSDFHHPEISIFSVSQQIGEQRSRGIGILGNSELLKPAFVTQSKYQASCAYASSHEKPWGEGCFFPLDFLCKRKDSKYFGSTFINRRNVIGNEYTIRIFPSCKEIEKKKNGNTRCCNSHHKTPAWGYLSTRKRKETLNQLALLFLFVEINSSPSKYSSTLFKYFEQTTSLANPSKNLAVWKSQQQRRSRSVKYRFFILILNFISKVCHLAFPECRFFVQISAEWVGLNSRSNWIATAWEESVQVGTFIAMINLRILLSFSFFKNLSSVDR
jgi:hypothetical protein